MIDHQAADERPLFSYRTLDIAVTVFFLIVCSIVITDSLRLGAGWLPNEGPAPGYFPFYIASVMAVATAVNLARALPRTSASEETVVTVPGITRMSAIFVPALAFVFATHFIGIYVSAALYIAIFMVAFGKFALWRAAAVSLGISIVSFMMFEVWFLVPLPKGPLEAALGY